MSKMCSTVLQKKSRLKNDHRKEFIRKNKLGEKIKIKMGRPVIINFKKRPSLAFFGGVSYGCHNTAPPRLHPKGRRFQIISLPRTSVSRSAIVV